MQQFTNIPQPAAPAMQPVVYVSVQQPTFNVWGPTLQLAGMQLQQNVTVPQQVAVPQPGLVTLMPTTLPVTEPMLPIPAIQSVLETVAQEADATATSKPDGKEDIQTPSSDTDQTATPTQKKPFLMRARASTSAPCLAGAFAKRLRLEECIELEAIGPIAVSQSMRAVQLARSFINSDNLSLNVVCRFGQNFRSADASVHPSLLFLLSRQSSSEDVTAVRQLCIDGGAIVGKTAGAISKVVRGMPVGPVLNLFCMSSPTAVITAMKALALAHLMLQEDNVSVKIQPMLPRSGCVRPADMDAMLGFTIISYRP